MAEIPESSNQEIPFHVDPCNFPSFGNVGPPMMATLSLPRLTIGLPVWLFSIPSVSNVLDASPISSPCQIHHSNRDPLLSRPVKSFPPSSSSSGESTVTSNQKSSKKKKKSKKPKQQINPLVSGHHTGGKPLALGHHADGKSLASSHHVEVESLTSSHHVEDNPLDSSR